MLRNPAGLPLLAWRLLRCWAAWSSRSRRLRRDGSWPDAVVVGYLGHFDVLLARRLFPHVPVVLDHLIGASDTATDRGVAGGLRQRLLRAPRRRRAGRADLVVVDTEEHRDALPMHGAAARRRRARSVHRPSWYAGNGPQRPRRARRPLRAVFFGLFTPLQGAPVIGAALAGLAGDAGRGHHGRHRPGPTTRPARLAAANGRVRWRRLGRARRAARRWWPSTTCASGIFGTGPKATRVVPNKVFQGAAAGCALVTSDTAPQRRVLGDAARARPARRPGRAGRRSARRWRADPATARRGPRGRATGSPATASPRPRVVGPAARPPARPSYPRRICVDQHPHRHCAARR